MSPKYQYYQHGNEVIAVSSFAGRKVRGIAKCSPNDIFDFEKGKELAAARCAQKIAMKRLKRASQKYLDASLALTDAMNHMEHMKEYYMNAVDILDAATADLINISNKFS